MLTSPVTFTWSQSAAGNDRDEWRTQRRKGYARSVKPTSATLVFVRRRTQLSRAAESELTLAGFEVLAVTDPRKLLEAARGRTVAAVVVPEVMLGGVWRKWKRDPELRLIPVVTVASGRRPFPLWPLMHLVRAGAHVSAPHLKRPGATADAVRASMAGGMGVAPTSREKLGEALWDVASVLKLVGPLFLIPVIMGIRMLGFAMSAVAVLVASDVLGDVGGCLGQRQRPSIRWSSWAWLVVFVVLAALAVASCGR